MKLILVHLSDIHFKSLSESILSRIEKLVAALGPIDRQPAGIAIVVTGDIAQSGIAKEYEVAEQFFATLHKEIEKTFPNIPIHFSLVPGNHDCNFSETNKIRDLVINNIRSPENIDPGYIANCVAAQEDFFAFAHRITGRSYPNRISWKEDWQVQGKQISFQCINTAWISQKQEKAGTLTFPATVFPNNSTDLVISIFHHPYGWLSPESAKLLQQAVESTSDAIFTGHEHYEDNYRKERDSHQIEYFEGGVLNTSKTPDKSEFRVVLVDLNKQNQTSIRLHWKNGFYKPAEGYTAEPKPLVRNALRLRNEFQLKSSFEVLLEDLGAVFTHPAKDTLGLSDVFVWPSLRVLSDDSSQSIEKRVRGDQSSAYLLKQSKVLILGDQDAGKTCLLKKMFRVMRDSELVPVFVDGSRFLKNSLERKVYLRIIQRSFEEEFGSPTWEQFLQLPKERRVLLLDNLNTVSLNADGVAALLQLLSSEFGIIIASADLLFRMERLSTLKNPQASLIDFSQVELLQFGNKQQLMLIERWLLAGREHNYSQSQLVRDSDQIGRIISSIMGKDLIPLYPLYILIILQQVEASRQHTTASGSLGYLFDYLINESLLRRSRKAFELSISRTYLAALARLLFTKKWIHLEKTDFLHFHQDHCNTFALDISFDSMIEYLTDCSILEHDSNGFRYKYSYLYTFFLALSLANSSDTDETKKILTSMCSCLHLEDNANVIVFFGYLQKSELLFREILSACIRILSESLPCDFRKDTTYIGQTDSDDDTGIFKISDKPARENRAAVAEAADKVDEIFKKEKKQEEVETLHHMNRAFKTIQVAGQLLRTYQGSLTRIEKFQLTEAVYSLGMRAMGYFLNLIRNDYDAIIDGFGKHIAQEKGEKISEDKARERAKKFVNWLFKMLGFAVIKRVSSAVGTKNLRLTYEEVLEKIDSVGTKLINISIRLDHFEEFPQNQITELHHRLQNNFFADGILKMLVIEHFTLFDVDRHKKQGICSILGIPYNQIQQLELKTHDTKRDP